MNRRSMTILTLLAAASLTAGCSTFSDNDAVARVGDTELSDSGLDDLLEEQAVPEEQRNDLNIARTAISGWIEATAVENGLFSPELIEEIPDDDLLALYRQGMEASGVSCSRLLVAPTLADAEAAADRIETGEDFETVFEELNIDPSLDATVGDVGCIEIGRVVEPGTEPSPDVRALLSVDAVNPTATATLPAADGSELGFLVAYRDVTDLPEQDLESVLGLIRGTAGVGLVLDDIDIHVDSRYGTFDRATGSVVPLL